MYTGTKLDKEFVFNYLFRNKVFDCAMELQTLEELYHRLAGEGIMLLDRQNLVATQLRLVRTELDNLIRTIDRCQNDFKNSDDEIQL